MRIKANENLRVQIEYSVGAYLPWKFDDPHNFGNPTILWDSPNVHRKGCGEYVSGTFLRVLTGFPVPYTNTRMHILINYFADR